MGALFQFRDRDLYCHCSLDEKPDPLSFPIHAHEMLEVFFFLSGHGQYLVEGSTYSLAPGDLLLMRPAEAHKLLIEPDVPYRRIAIHFAPQVFDVLDAERRLLRPFYNHPLGQRNHYPTDIYPQLRHVFDGFSLTEGLERLQILSCLLSLLAQLASMDQSDGPLPPAVSFPSALVAYVNAHLFEPLTLSQISDHFSRSISQISRVFRQATGTSLWEYVLIKRLLTGRALLQRGERASDACLACGFDDYSTFYRAYKKRFGCAPVEDRSHMTNSTQA